MKKIYILINLMLVSGISIAQWTVLNSGTTTTLYGIYATTNDSCYATGDYEVLKSSNQGTSWSNEYLATVGFRSIYFVSPTTGFIAGGLGNPNYYSYVYKTTDSGISWQIKHYSSPNGLYSIRFVNSTTGYACGGPTPLIFKTTNGGNGWISQSSAVSQWLNCIYPINENTVFCIGYGGAMQKTTNGGINWVSVFSSTNNDLTGICFPTSLIGYAVGNNGTIIKTTDGGDTWAMQNIGSSVFFRKVYFWDALEGYIVGNYGTILHTTNGGTVWNSETSGTTQHLLDINFLNHNLGYACGTDGTILKYKSNEGVNERINNLVKINIYPNPATNYITIETTERASLEICNLEGQIIKTIDNEGIKTTMDISQLTNGVYILKAQNNNGMAIKKFIKD